MRGGAAPEEVVNGGVGGERPAGYSYGFAGGGVDGSHEAMVGISDGGG